MVPVHTGGCLCGAVRFSATGSLRGVIYCHCSQCRRQSGHFYAATCVPDAALAVEGSDSVTWYRASAGAERGFCRTCGSALFWKRDESSETSLLAGAFDTADGLTGKAHIFVADKGGYYAIDDGLPQHEESLPSGGVAKA